MRVRIMTENRRAKWAHEQRHSKGGVDGRKRQGPMLLRKKLRSDDRGDVEQDEEIKQVESPSEGRSDDRASHMLFIQPRYVLIVNENLSRRHCIFLSRTRAEPCFAPSS